MTQSAISKGITASMIRKDERDKVRREDRDHIARTLPR
jgi:hypothetical protein